MKPVYFSVLLILITSFSMAQTLPFSQIPEAPKEITAANSLMRMIQGLGFRYYWATEGLREEDLDYRPTVEAASSLETLQHLHILCKTIAETFQNKPSIRPAVRTSKSLDVLRSETLNNLATAAQILSEIKLEADAVQIVFERDGVQTKFPIWNLINGPISDALYHTGQVVSFRRTTGNPIAKGVNVFLGTKTN